MFNPHQRVFIECMSGSGLTHRALLTANGDVLKTTTMDEVGSDMTFIVHVPIEGVYYLLMSDAETLMLSAVYIDERGIALQTVDALALPDCFTIQPFLVRLAGKKNGLSEGLLRGIVRLCDTFKLMDLGGTSIHPEFLPTLVVCEDHRPSYLPDQLYVVDMLEGSSLHAIGVYIDSIVEQQSA